MQKKVLAPTKPPARTSSPTTNEPEIMHHELSTSLPPTNKSYQEISQRNFSSGPLNLAIPKEVFKKQNVHLCKPARYSTQTIPYQTIPAMANDGHPLGGRVKCWLQASCRCQIFNSIAAAPAPGRRASYPRLPQFQPYTNF